GVRDDRQLAALGRAAGARARWLGGAHALPRDLGARGRRNPPRGAPPAHAPRLDAGCTAGRAAPAGRRRRATPGAPRPQRFQAMRKPVILAATAALLLSAAAPAFAGDVDCKLTFDLSGWSVFYKTASGTGVVTCDNGQRLPVKITTQGGGLSF